MSILNSVPVANISYDTLYPDTKVMSKTSIHYPDCKVNYTTICCIPLIALIDQVPGAGGVFSTMLKLSIIFRWSSSSVQPHKKKH